MSEFAHVENDKLRGYLDHGSMENDEVADILAFCREAYIEDERNAEIPAGVMKARHQHLEDAEVQFNQNGDLFETWKSLRSMWSV